MEHKLITGGHQYLPFARSRIKAMRAVGLRYATQRFVLPDATVRVQIVDGTDYIELSGGTCELGMDSGVVELSAIGSAAPGRFLPGILYETNKVAAYNAPFVLTAPETYWRFNSGPTGQISGTLSSALRGKVPINGQSARSFHPRSIDNADTPPIKILDPADESLYAKKVLAVLCPPSIFTGRCRLWVQSMYGRHMHSHASNGMPDDDTVPIPTLSGLPGTPSIYVQGKAASGTLSVLITTSCGVYLDPDTGNHWLLKVNGAQVLVYPLLSSPCGQRLRKYLVSGTGNDLLDQTDRDHVEAYVLSTSRPDTTQIVAVEIGASVAAYSMGYGWHWNWTGMVADIVINTPYAQNETHAAMTSTHHRITMHKPTDTTPWLCIHSVVEGPTNWAVYRVYWTIVEPDWSDLVLRKTTPANSAVFAGNAPFYAFYVGDVLKTCRVSVVLQDGHIGALVENDVTGTEGFTIGTKEGTRTISSDGADYFSATFSCAGMTTPPLEAVKVIDYSDVIVVKDKVFGVWLSGTGSGGFGFRLFNVSNDDGSNYHQEGQSSSLVDENQTRAHTHTASRSTAHEEINGTAMVVVPFNDAQAVYLRYARESNYTVLTNITYYLAHQNVNKPGAFLVKDVTDGVPSEFAYARVNGAFAASDLTQTGFETIIPALATVSLGTTQQQAGHAGTVAATFTHLSDFSNNALETVAAQFATISGTDIVSPVVIAPGYITEVGTPTVPTVPALVGWV